MQKKHIRPQGLYEILKGIQKTIGTATGCRNNTDKHNSRIVTDASISCIHRAPRHVYFDSLHSFIVLRSCHWNKERTCYMLPIFNINEPFHNLFDRFMLEPAKVQYLLIHLSAFFLLIKTLCISSKQQC